MRGQKKRGKMPMWKELGLTEPLKKRKCRVYRVWERMKARCSQRPSFLASRWAKYYRHVTVCEEWREFPPFFIWAKSHGYRDDLTLDRIDGSLGYFPANCRWATRSEQNRNRHYSEAYRAAARRNAAKARAAQAAKRAARQKEACDGR